MTQIDVLRKLACILAVAFALAAMPAAAHAHHGWGWATGEEFEVTGTIQDIRLGNPHGELTILVDGEPWMVEIGQPWRNERAGLTRDLLTQGTEVTVHGHRAADGSDLVKAERVMIDGREFVLYPNRESAAAN